MNSKYANVLGLGITFAAGLGLAEACKSTQVNSNHCSFLAGDETCRERHAEENLVFCGGDCVDSEHNDGCVEAKPTGCYYPCGDDMLAEDDMSCVGTTETDTNASTLGDPTGDPSGDPTTNEDSSATDTLTSGETETTDPTGDTGPTGCQTSEDCTNADEPVCLSNECVPCTGTPEPDDACAAKDPTMPVCTDDGQCVQCEAGNATACTDTTPVCDPGTGSCVGCTFHEQCSETACNIATGACFDGDCVRSVDGDGLADFDNISEAIGDGCVIIVHEVTGGYPESVAITEGETVALLAAPDELPGVTGVDLNPDPALSISGGSTVYIQGLAISGNDNNGVGVSVDGANVWIDQAQLTGNTGGGLVLNNAANGRLRNCFVDGAFDVAAVLVDSSSVDVLYSTLGGSGGASATLNCNAPLSATVRNSILVSRAAAADDLVCEDAMITFSALEAARAGEGNVVLGDLTMANQDVWFVDYMDGDFGLNMPPDAVLTAAQWLSGDPLVDIDDDLRPNVDMTADVAGADIP